MRKKPHAHTLERQIHHLYKCNICAMSIFTKSTLNIIVHTFQFFKIHAALRYRAAWLVNFFSCSIVWLVRCDYCQTPCIMMQFNFFSPLFYPTSAISFSLHMKKRWNHLKCSRFPVNTVESQILFQYGFLIEFLTLNCSKSEFRMNHLHHN